MSATNQPIADGSATEDAHEPVTINRSKEAERWRFVCPNGHTDWSPTNSHIHCKGCRRQFEAGESDINAEHWELLDKQTGEEIPYSAVELVEEPRDQRRPPRFR